MFIRETKNMVDRHFEAWGKITWTGENIRRVHIIASIFGRNRDLVKHHAAAAKSLQSCLTLYDPIDGSPPGSPVPGILQARTLKWVAISFSNAWKWKVKVKSLSRIWLLALASQKWYGKMGLEVRGSSLKTGSVFKYRTLRLDCGGL